MAAPYIQAGVDVVLVSFNQQVQQSATTQKSKNSFLANSSTAKKRRTAAVIQRQTASRNSSFSTKTNSGKQNKMADFLLPQLIYNTTIFMQKLSELNIGLNTSATKKILRSKRAAGCIHRTRAGRTQRALSNVLEHRTRQLYSRTFYPGRRSPQLVVMATLHKL